jgi:hypothetical protein
MHAPSRTLSSTAFPPRKARRLKRRVNVQQDQPSLFDLLLDQSRPWEALEAEQQLQAIDILARLIANATTDNGEEDEHD